MAIRHLGFTLAGALVFLPAALPAAPFLLKDLNTSLPLEPAGFNLRVRGIGPEVSYFAGSDPAHGIELWRSDGTPGGTGRLTDICAGRCNSLPASITVHAGRVFFAADDGFSGTELWVSDGTPGSERRLRDICPGPCSAVPSLVEEVRDRLLFVSHFPAEPARFELWQTDGTRDGTDRVKVLCTSDCIVSSDSSSRRNRPPPPRRLRGFAFQLAVSSVALESRHSRNAAALQVAVKNSRSRRRDLRCGGNL